MKFVEVKELPKRRIKSCLRASLDEFMAMNTKICKVEGFTHKDEKSAQASFSVSAKNGGYPVDVKIVNGELYLIRRDM